MLSLLYEGEPGQTLTLRDMMNPEYQLFDVMMVTDDCGNEYPHGSNTYAWGFEVCLWHHARSKHIEPLFDDETQREAWEEHLRHQHLPPRPDSSADRAAPGTVPFRLVEGVDPAPRAARGINRWRVGRSTRSGGACIGCWAGSTPRASKSRGYHACEVALIDLLLGLLGPPLRKPLREPLAVDLGLNGVGAEELLKVLRLDLLLGFISFAIFTIF